MSKLLQFDLKAKESLLRGSQILANAVGTTLGPLGNNVALDMKWSEPKVVHDGVTVVKEIDLEDPFENMGAKLIKEAASKTNDVAGDGTTTATILSNALLVEGVKAIEAGILPMRLRRGMQLAGKQAIEYVTSQATKLTTTGEIKQIATISAQDEEIGAKVTEALDKVGLEGVVTVEEGSEKEITVEYKEGMQFDKGYVSPYLVTDQDKMEAEVSAPYVLITNHIISHNAEITGILEVVIQKSKNIVIIADNFEGDALLALITQKLRGAFNILAIKSPAWGDSRTDLLQDIAILTNATFIDKVTRKLSSLTLEDLGQATKVVSTGDSTIIVAQGAVEERVSHIKGLIKSADSDVKKERLQGRLAKLSSGAAIIRVGAVTEAELKEKKERVIDAVAATKAAIEEGIVAGGQTLLFRAASKIKNTDENLQAGVEVVKTALTKPFKKLIDNSGLDYLESLDKLTASKEGEGIDVMDGNLKDLIKAGIIDPVKVIRSVIENSISVAGSILTTTVLITEKEEKKNEN